MKNTKKDLLERYESLMEDMRYQLKSLCDDAEIDFDDDGFEDEKGNDLDGVDEDGVYSNGELIYSLYSLSFEDGIKVMDVIVKKKNQAQPLS